MRVLHYVPVFSQLSETFIYNSILCLGEMGIENAVVTDSRKFEQERPFAPVYTTDPAASRLRRLGRFLQLHALDAAWQKSVDAAIETFRPDLIQAHFGSSGYNMLPAARRHHLPLVTAFHGFDVFVLGPRPTWAIRYRRLRREGAAFTFVSEYMLKAAVQMGFPKERSRIIHVGVREADFPFGLPSSKEWSGELRLISIGSLVEKKGHADLIRALAGLRDGGGRATLTLIGDGPLRAELEGLRDSLGLGERVFFLGGQHRDRVREELGKAHVFALTSKTARNGNKEGIPTVMMEAQMAGLPVCATLHSGIPEVIPEKFRRWLAPEGDVEGIGKCLQDILASRSQWDEAATLGQEHILRHFSLKTETGKLAELYEQLVKAGKS